MLEKSTAAVLFQDIFGYVGLEPDKDAGTDSFALHFEGDTQVRVDYDEEDGVLWLTTPLAPVSVEAAVRLVPALLRSNFDTAEEGRSRAFDVASGSIIVQSRIENTFAQLADFEVAMTRHLEAVADTQSEIAAAQADQTHPAAQSDAGQPANMPIIWG